MKDFLDVAKDINATADNKDEDFSLVFDAISELQRVHSKASLDLDNIESVFAAFEMANVLRRLGDFQEIERLPRAMKRVIQKTLTEKVRFNVAQAVLQPADGYKRFAKIISDAVSGGPAATDLFRPRQYKNFSVITFNYDLCVDYALRFNDIPIRYCLNATDPMVLDFVLNSVAVLKLHGSLNWAQCSECKEISSVDISKAREKQYFNLANQNTKPIVVDFSGLSHCGKPLIDPYIVPPTWNKTQYHSNLEFVWRQAAAELSEAENIFVCGYSLPDTDYFFRYLFALGSVGRVRLKKFWVFDPDASVEGKFRKLLGQDSLPRFEYHTDGFEVMSHKVRPIFGLTSN